MIALSRPVRRVTLRAADAGMAVGAAALALGLLWGSARAELALLAASWLFFAGLAAGGVAVSVAIRLSGGRWAGAVLPATDATARFFVPALALQVVLLVCAPRLLPWAAEAGPRALALLAVRELVPTAALFALGAWHVRAARGSARAPQAADAGTPAVAYLVAYALALSLWAYDWILSPAHLPYPTAVPALYLVGAFLSGLAFAALATALRGGDADTRHDLGKLLFAFSVLWGYLVWALYLSAWYANVPAEAVHLLGRWRGAFRPASLAVMGAVLVFPFGLLFPERLKRRRDALAVGAAVVLAGLWAERHLLVLPAQELPHGPAEAWLGAAVAAGVASAFVRFVALAP